MDYTKKQIQHAYEYFYENLLAKTNGHVKMVMINSETAEIIKHLFDKELNK